MKHVYSRGCPYETPPKPGHRTGDRARFAGELSYVNELVVAGVRMVALESERHLSQGQDDYCI